MNFSDKCVRFIASWEALFLQSYDDATDRIVPLGGVCRGTLTIGLGHTTAAGPPTVTPGMVITRDQAYAILAADLLPVDREIGHYITAPLTQQQRDALGSFQFNTGWISHPHCSLAAAVNGGARIPTVTDDFCLYDRASGRVLPGLLRRRRAEAAIFSSGVYVGANGEIIT